jgi:hypothetical protein
MSMRGFEKKAQLYHIASSFFVVACAATYVSAEWLEIHYQSQSKTIIA